jgi:hypothetical protein
VKCYINNFMHLRSYIRNINSHSAGLVDQSYFSIPDGLKFRGQGMLLELWEKSLTPAL